MPPVANRRDGTSPFAPRSPILFMWIRKRGNSISLWTATARCATGPRLRLPADNRTNARGSAFTSNAAVFTRASTAIATRAAMRDAARNAPPRSASASGPTAWPRGSSRLVRSETTRKYSRQRPGSYGQRHTRSASRPPRWCAPRDNIRLLPSMFTKGHISACDSEGDRARRRAIRRPAPGCCGCAPMPV